MKSLVKKTPLPLAGLMLALAAIGNLVQSYGEVYRNVFGFLSTIILALIIGKMILYPRQVKEELANPVIASVFPTFTMGIMLISTYIKPFLPNFAFIVWSFSIGLHIFLMIRFTLNHVVNFNMKKVFPSWFIVYVGIVVGSVTAPAYEMQAIGKILFSFGLISYFLILPLALKRISLNNIPEAALSTIAIFTAPVALCLAGYMSSFEFKNMNIVWPLLAMSQFIYVLVLIYLPKLLKLKFYPSISALTFPLVISAISLKLSHGFLVKSGKIIPILGYMVKFQEIVALLIVVYVLTRYVQYFVFSMGEEAPRSNVKSIKISK